MRGLVLEGGGTKGAYQIGAYKALRELGLEFNGVTGTSIGALNGAYIVQNDIKVMEDLWLTYDYTYFMDIDEENYEKIKNIEFSARNINAVVDLINKARKNEGIDITPLRNLLEKTLDEVSIRNSGKDFGLVSAYWDKKIVPQQLFLEDIPSGRLVEYLIASASLPIFRQNIMDDKLYLDGVFCDNMPISMLADKGYDEIVVIRLVDDFLGKRNLNRHQDINLKTIVPSESLGGVLNKDKNSVQRNMNLGYLDTMKVYRRYEGNKYYFNLDYKYNDDYCFEKLTNLRQETIEGLCNLLGIKKEPTKRTLVENVIPTIGDLLKLDKEFSYKDLFYCIYEKKLEENNISRIKLYDFNSVVNRLHKNVNNNVHLDIKPMITLQKNRVVKLMTSAIISDLSQSGGF
jgi:NTE family protein